jgi:hypothetical protein
MKAIYKSHRRFSILRIKLLFFSAIYIKMKNQVKDKTIRLRITNKTYEELIQHSNAHNTTYSALIRLLIKDLLNRT